MNVFFVIDDFPESHRQWGLFLTRGERASHFLPCFITSDFLPWQIYFSRGKTQFFPNVEKSQSILPLSYDISPQDNFFICLISPPNFKGRTGEPAKHPQGVDKKDGTFRRK